MLMMEARGIIKSLNVLLAVNVLSVYLRLLFPSDLWMGTGLAVYVIWTLMELFSET